MSNLITRTITGKDNAPVYFPTGIAVGNGTESGGINKIGIAGQQGFGVGICPALPTGMSELFGTRDQSSDNYGNYIYSDGSIMVWIPAFVYKYNADNTVLIKSLSDYTTVAAANIDGYALHRAFYNAGAVQPGIFVDKYQVSKNNLTASSIKNGNPLTSFSSHNPFTGLGVAGITDTYGSAIDVIKTRGSKFFCNSVFAFKALALLSLAHGQASSSNANCAWYDAAGITNYPKGNNNGSLKDSNDLSVSYVGDGYSYTDPVSSVVSYCGKTGSANFFAKTTHNGQNCGIADLNGNVWEINLGLTAINGVTPADIGFYLLNTSADISALTNAVAATGNAAFMTTPNASLYTKVSTTNYAYMANTVKVWPVNNSTLYGIGSASQTFSADLTGNDWALTGAGLPLDGAKTGTNKFGNDGLWYLMPDQLCAISGGDWSTGGLAGLWGLSLHNVRGHSNPYVGCRAALYL